MAPLLPSRPSQDINQSLVDDSLVDVDKIGASNFFWSFPSKVVVTRRNLVESLKRDIAKVGRALPLQMSSARVNRGAPSCSIQDHARVRRMRFASCGVDHTEVTYYLITREEGPSKNILTFKSSTVSLQSIALDLSPKRSFSALRRSFNV